MDPSFAGTLLIIIGASGLLTLIVLTLMRRAAARRRRLQLELDRLRNDFAMVQAGNIGLGKALMRLQRQIHQANTTPEPAATKGSPAGAAEQASRSAANDEPEFERAEQLLRAGATLEQVTRETGLTRSEAELMQLLQHPGYEVATG